MRGLGPLLLLLLLLLVGLVGVQPRDIEGARDLRKDQGVGDGNPPAVDDASVRKRLVLAELALALDNVSRAVWIVDDLPVELLDVAASGAGARTRPLRLGLECHGGPGGRGPSSG